MHKEKRRFWRAATRRFSVASVPLGLLVLTLCACAPSASAGDSAGSFRALCVGLRYPGTKDGLRFTTDDVRAVAESFRRASGYGGDGALVEVLVDDDPKAAKPTAREILRRLGRIAAEAGEKDRLIFYFSGHGLLGDGGRSILVASGGTDMRDASAHVFLSDVKNIFASSRAADKLVIVDACHSGGKSADSGDLTPDSVAAAFGGGKGGGAEEVAWLVSCSANEKSWEDDESGHGLFTRYLLEVLGDGAEFADVDYDGMLSLSEIHQHVSSGIASYIRDKVYKRDARWRGVSQTPRVGSGGVAAEPGAVELRRMRFFYCDNETAVTPSFSQTLYAKGLKALGPAASFDESGALLLDGFFADNIAEAIEILGKTDEGPDSAPQDMAGVWNLLGECLLLDGVNRDVARAASLFRRASDAGEAAAQVNLAVQLLLTSNGGERKEGVSRLLAAEKQGNAKARFWIGYCYLYGLELDRDVARAVDLIRRAAEDGYWLAATTLGELLETGTGIDRDAREAVRWLERGASHGSTEARFQMGMRYLDGNTIEQDYRKAVAWLRRAGERNHGQACLVLGDLYYEGVQGIGQNLAEAVEWYVKSSEQNVDQASSKLLQALVKHGDFSSLSIDGSRIATFLLEHEKKEKEKRYSMVSIALRNYSIAQVTYQLGRLQQWNSQFSDAGYASNFRLLYYGKSGRGSPISLISKVVADAFVPSSESGRAPILGAPISPTPYMGYVFMDDPAVSDWDRDYGLFAFPTNTRNGTYCFWLGSEGVVYFREYESKGLSYDEVRTVGSPLKYPKRWRLF